MKKLFAALTAGVILSASGCMTPQPLTVPADPADRPAPRPVKLPPAKTNADADGITEANYGQQATELEQEMSRERKMVEPAK